MDSINRIVPVTPVNTANVYGVDRDRKERPRQQPEEHKDNHGDVVEIHDEVVEPEPHEAPSEHHDVDISA
ncbi:MAG: hypothetical protein JSS65_13405 [Armatimonadetes bacterium]|nr:hypothetical protein [Armatimonadota bacterium]